MTYGSMHRLSAGRPGIIVLGSRSCSFMENLGMDELLKQVLCSIGVTYLVLRFGHSIMTLYKRLSRG